VDPRSFNKNYSSIYDKRGLKFTENNLLQWNQALHPPIEELFYDINMIRSLFIGDNKIY